MDRKTKTPQGVFVVEVIGWRYDVKYEIHCRSAYAFQIQSGDE
ncbi:MAG: hypothetical protein UX49_C0033G0008 [Candidatus Wolfebacteria bacterium GW2011_GWC2_46_275]|uniref:Uncharacterized protein n=1 Tax=Candidatus Wolfebacteria bacterium GW2011_GWB1_47_1 TaxID=1619007 RepID=A0A0G4AVK4_9BACT|nr:MAG: hypothetical protein UX70_C0001G1041 [Candidatus Wolfebacteria bacterium GW2011_GWB1_47_1]KKU34871.1 MAG: hypothetical protein UX49_C0033G0008 [Candidatus Wolfebacteria bacterium GW2011_GWC2_46_275]KKU53385.1 MAG: hypothetical protein UX76_C0018G0004 [Candidatus Wolfebacteria bacterium GW2011_GWC1_47_103]KKU58835.1 MAG: hypothetical protein UX83_C0011G0047 [Candidatus Wolfebacteria bacterium GW2011_GWE2_47_12]KKU65424.1 MAG: hypothetical protein UX90_C0006G0028 [Candidatus Wolfebacteria